MASPDRATMDTMSIRIQQTYDSIQIDLILRHLGAPAYGSEDFESEAENCGLTPEGHLRALLASWTRHNILVPLLRLERGEL